MASLNDLFRAAGGYFGIDPGVLSKVAGIESSYRPGVVQDPRVNDVNMRAGNPAGGLFQFIPQTFERYYNQMVAAYPQLRDIVPKDRFDPVGATMTAAFAFSKGGIKEWGSWDDTGYANPIGQRTTDMAGTLKKIEDMVGGGFSGGLGKSDSAPGQMRGIMTDMAFRSDGQTVAQDSAQIASSGAAAGLAGYVMAHAVDAGLLLLVGILTWYGVGGLMR